MSVKTCARVACLLLLSLSLAGCLGLRRRPVVVVTTPGAPGPHVGHEDCPHEAPPAPRAERRPRAPTTVHVWVPGRWAWRHGRYVWIGGHWVEPDRRGAMWVSGHWAKQGSAWIWVDGHWR